MFEDREDAKGTWTASRKTMRRWLKTSGAAAIVAAAVSVGTMSGGRIAAEGIPDPELRMPELCDFATSGGFVLGATGKKASFGAHGGCKNGEFWGHVNFVDHATGLHINSTEITGYAQPVDEVSGEPIANARDICGIATTNRGSGTAWFRVRLVDGGEPSTDDLFGIKIFWKDGSYDTLDLSPRNLSTGKGGGDVQLHAPNASTIAPVVLPDWVQMCQGVYAPGVQQPSGGNDID